MNTINRFLYHLNTKPVKSGTKIFDYGQESCEIYIVLHGKVDVLIPSNSVIEIDKDQTFQSKVKCLAYCIINFDMIMWQVMTYEIDYNKHFDIKNHTENHHIGKRCKIEI